MNRVIVLGSINLDTTLRMVKLPLPGETVHAHEVFSSGGGKGANQAIAAQRSGAQTSFVGAIGTDAAGTLMLDLMHQDGIDCSLINTLENERTGSAIVMVDDLGENSIVINSGANNKIDLESQKGFEEQLKKSDFLISQFEINQDAIIAAFQRARDCGVVTVLNPAPAIENIPKKLLQNTDILIPNQSEIEIISKRSIHSEEDLDEIGKSFLKMGVKGLIVTLGSKGSYFYSSNSSGFVPAIKVNAVDTTGAGDTYIGALVSVLKKDLSNFRHSIEYATAASAISVQRFGAQPSIPYNNEIEDFVLHEKINT